MSGLTAFMAGVNVGLIVAHVILLARRRRR